MRLLVLCSLLLFCGCSVPGVVGSGNIQQESRQVDDFTKVSFAGGGDIKIVAGADKPSCAVQCDDNLLSYISTEVVDKELRIRVNGSSKISPTQGMQIEISVPDLNSLELSGGTTTSVTGLKPAVFDVQLSGNHDLQCEGQADQFHIQAQGACKILAAKLTSKSATINLVGSGSVDVQASETLDVKIAGTGRVRYVGDPAITQSIAGAGKIEKLD